MLQFRSMFASVCDLKVILAMWDVYLQSCDPFLAFFMALVILVNARDQILEAETRDKQVIMGKYYVPVRNSLAVDR